MGSGHWLSDRLDAFMVLLGGFGEGVPPIHGTWTAVDGWLTSLPLDTSTIRSDVAWSPVFSEQPYRAGSAVLARAWRFSEYPSWLGGPALLPLPEWPRRRDGIPLAHVAAVNLEDVSSASVVEEKAAWPVHEEGLPTTGYLEVFHDLVETYGWEVGDRATGGWSVRWVPEPESRHLADPPADLDTPTDACQAGIFLPGWSSRPPLDFLSDQAGFDTAEWVQEANQRGWWLQRTGESTELARPVTHVYGHSQNATGPAAEVLREALPLGPGDVHRLVLEVESFTHLAGWFGDAASLEVWMRASDLAGRRFDQAWCITRTD